MIRNSRSVARTSAGSCWTRASPTSKPSRSPSRLGHLRGKAEIGLRVDRVINKRCACLSTTLSGTGVAALLSDLSTIVRSTCRRRAAGSSEPSFDLATTRPLRSQGGTSVQGSRFTRLLSLVISVVHRSPAMHRVPSARWHGRWPSGHLSSWSFLHAKSWRRLCTLGLYLVASAKMSPEVQQSLPELMPTTRPFTTTGPPLSPGHKAELSPTRAGTTCFFPPPAPR